MAWARNETAPAAMRRRARKPGRGGGFPPWKIQVVFYFGFGHPIILTCR
jgi:hypothetical protein